MSNNVLRRGSKIEHTGADDSLDTKLSDFEGEKRLERDLHFYVKGKFSNFQHYSRVFL